MTTTRQLRESWRAFLSDDEARMGPWWMRYVWAAILAVFCAVGFTLLNISLHFSEATARPSVWWQWFRTNFIISLTITMTISFLFSAAAKVIGRQRMQHWTKPWRSAYYAVVPIVGVSIAWPVALLWLVDVDVRRSFSLDQPGALFASVAFAILIIGVFSEFFSIKARQIRAENNATEAQLRLLQAQMEPHFLFNTLANVVSLMERDTPRAKAMLESLVDYLRASLTGLGQTTHTVGDEIDLVEAYMRIIKMRMEGRLSYAIDVPEALRSRRLPALTLQPLVENAIVHGLEPQIGGGTIRVTANLDRGMLVLTVEDDGAGIESGHTAGAPRSRSGSGTALANIRERLRQGYGASAALRLDPVDPHGVRARLTLPVSG